MTASLSLKTEFVRLSEALAGAKAIVRELEKELTGLSQGLIEDMLRGKSHAGFVYTPKQKVAVTDWDAFQGWIKENMNLNALQMRAQQSYLQGLGYCPPGCEIVDSLTVALEGDE
jgi:hypothetical protein